MSVHACACGQACVYTLAYMQVCVRVCIYACTVYSIIINDPKTVNPNTHESPTVAGEKRRSTSEENGTGDVNLSKHFTASSAEDASSRTTHDVEGTPGERTPTMINDLGELICLHRHVKR